MNNIFWIVTDSARNFSTGGLDDRDMPEFYGNLGSDFVEFEQCITSAPSSVMSGASMLTGREAYSISHNYEQFRYSTNYKDTIIPFLTNKGFNCHGIFVAREMREKIAPLIGEMDYKFWPKGLKHSAKMWNNSQANEVLENMLQVLDPLNQNFVLLWNNIRHDNNISQRLEEIIKMIKKYNFYDNSMIIFNSDHGYPHPNRGITPENLKREGLTHDIMLQDDNILTPLYIKCGFQRSAVSEIVGLIDIAPTINEIFNLEYGNQDIDGCSLIPLLKGEFHKPKYYRTDCRFFGQEDQRTSVRTADFKYVFSHKIEKEELYDLNTDENEDINIINEAKYKSVLAQMRLYLKKSSEKNYKRIVTNWLLDKCNTDHKILIIENSNYSRKTVEEQLKKDKKRFDFIKKEDIRSTTFCNEDIILSTVPDLEVSHDGFERFNIDEWRKKQFTGKLTVKKIIKAIYSRRKFIVREPTIVAEYISNFLKKLIK